MEHHANIVPWLMLAEESGLEMRYIPVDGEGRLDLDDLDHLGGRGEAGRASRPCRTSSAPSTRSPKSPPWPTAPAPWSWSTGPSWCPTLPIDVTALGADFLAFSAHKMLGPTGIGVLWAREELLNAMPPFLGGGGMILDVRN